MTEEAADKDQDEGAKGSDAESLDPVFTALWNRVLEAWDEEKPHQAILQHALDKQMLPELAGRYRGLTEDPEKGARAKKKMDGIVVAATQMLLAMKTPAPTKTPWQWTAFAGITFVVVIGWLAYAMFGRR